MTRAEDGISCVVSAADDGSCSSERSYRFFKW